MFGFQNYLGLVVLLQCSIFGLASPVLKGRTNHNPQQQKCSNAPAIIAGNMVKPSDTIPPPLAVAARALGLEFLFCVPNTQTYLFFDLPANWDTHNAQPLHPQQNYADALAAGIASINNTIATAGDKVIPHGSQTLPDTEFIRIYAEDAGGQHLTWGVFGAALAGLNAWMEALKVYQDATYQINDGANLVGQGYIGTVVADGSCVFHAAFTSDTPCVAYDKNGLVYSY